MPKKKKVENEVQEESRAITITRSFARKLNMAAHGGKQYETADLFCSITMESTEADFSHDSSVLDQLCQDEVQKTIDAFDSEEAAVESAEIKPEKKKKIVNVGIKAEQDEMEAIQEYVNDLTLSKTPEDLKAAVTKIQKNMATFNDTQKKYLSAYYLKRKEALK